MRGFKVFLGMAIALAPTGAVCQTSVSVGASVLNGYILRGVTFTNGTVIQPDLAIKHPFAGGSVLLGAFANIEPSRRVGANDLSQTGGIRSGLAEVDVWAEYARDIGAVHAIGGVLVYAYDHGNATTSNLWNTAEVYGKFALASLPLAPEVRAWWDVRTIHGWYLEGQLTRPVRLAGQEVTFAAVAGMAAGQERQGVSDTFYNFAQAGLTHLDLSATSTFTFGSISAAPIIHVQYAPKGQNSRIVGALSSHWNQASHIWFGVRLGGAVTLGSRSARQAAEEGTSEEPK